MDKILIVDDDRDHLQVMATALKHESFHVFTACTGLEGLRAAFAAHPDLVILDIMLPDMDGFEICRRLREFSDTPVIMLTARSTKTDVVKGLSIGADDYITKPFSLAELLARVRTALRHRGASDLPKASVLIHGDLVVDMAKHQVTVRGRPVDLSPTEFRLLAYLARNDRCVVPHRTLLMEIWGPEYCDQTDYLHLYIRYLRQKIEADPTHPEIIKTERGIGYYLD